jgi:hypothetical protein
MILIRFYKKLNQGNLNIKCFECSSDVSCSNIQFFLYQIGKGYFEKYEKLSFNRFMSNGINEVMWCPTPGCEFVFEMAEKFQNFLCRLCKKKYKILCISFLMKRFK